MHPGHWSESIFGDEMMTPVSPVLGSGNPALLSRISIGALQDLGYKVDYSKADIYSPPTGTDLTGSQTAVVHVDTTTSAKSGVAGATVLIPTGLSPAPQVRLLPISNQLPIHIYDAAIASISKFDLRPAAQLFGGNMLDENLSG